MVTEEKIIKVEQADSSRFESLEDRMLFYRSQVDYKLEKKNYIMVMLDGKNFSTKIKKKFKLPFDNEFIILMNDTASYVCSQVQGAKLAYVQSDEISIVITDFDTEETAAFFNFRLCKMLSIIPALATSYFNREIDKRIVASSDNALQKLEDEPLYQFDAKVWICPTYNDVFAWFLYRQNDCIRNSKQQVAQAWLSHKHLLKKSADEQISKLKETIGIDWKDYNSGEKYGRLIYKENVAKTTVVKGQEVEFERSVWKSHYCPILSSKEGKSAFNELNIIPQKNNTDENF